MLFICALLMGCASQPRTHIKMVPAVNIRQCLDMQVRLYGDICAESSTGYEDAKPSDAHLFGVLCAVESIRMCLNFEQ
jgi:hypothetical protein